jgi:hypothetical protein
VSKIEYPSSENNITLLNKQDKIQSLKEFLKGCIILEVNNL